MYDVVPVNVRVSVRNGQPMLELSKSFTRTEWIKMLIIAAMNGGTLVMAPNFYPDRVQAYNSLRERGILVDKDGPWEFAI